MLEHVQFSNDSQTLFTIEFGRVAGLDEEQAVERPLIRCWDLSDGKQIGLPRPSIQNRPGKLADLGEVWPLKILPTSSPDTYAVLLELGTPTGKPSSELRIVDLSNETTLRKKEYPGIRYFDMKRSKGNWILLSSERVVVLDESLGEIAVLDNDTVEMPYKDVELISDSEIYVLPFSDSKSEIRSWDWKTNQKKSIATFDEKAIQVAFDPKSSLLAVAFPKRVEIKNSDGEVMGRWEANGWVWDTFFHQNKLVVNNSRHGIALWDFRNDSKVLLDSHETPAQGLAVSSTGDRVATAGEDGRVKIWDTKTGIELFDIGEYPGHIRSVCFSSDESQLIFGTCDSQGKRIGEIFSLSK